MNQKYDLCDQIAQAQARVNELERSNENKLKVALATERLAALMRLADVHLLPQALNLEAKARQLRETYSDATGCNLDAPVRSEAPSKQIGTGIGKYTLLAEIGKGRSSTVYKAAHNETHAQVAIKIFHRNTLTDSALLAHFRNESKSLISLSNANIVYVHGFGTAAGGEPYMVMDVAEGANLKQLLKVEKCFSSARTATVARQICHALNYAHARGIIHRDLKPTNIIVSFGDRVKVCDFGVASNLGADNDVLTESIATAGSPAYMSPEQCTGETIDARSDIYSLGCVMFEMLVGQKAFDSSTSVGAILKHLSGNSKYVEDCLSTAQVPSALQVIVLKCLSKDPEKRFQSAAELELSLSAFQLSIAPPGTIQLFVRRRASLLLQLAILVCIGTFAVKFLTEPAAEGGTAAGALQKRLSALMSDPPAKTVVNKAPDFAIRDRHTGNVIFQDASARSLRDLVQLAVEKRVSMRSADLSEADLHQLQLDGADFTWADLTNATLDRASLQRADFTDASLESASLKYADLLSANLNKAALRCAFLNHANLKDASLVGADLREADLSRTDLSSTLCSDAQFDRAKLVETHMDHSSFEGASFVGCTPVLVRVEESNFTDAIMPDYETRLAFHRIRRHR